MAFIDYATLLAALGDLRQPLQDGTLLGDQDRKLLTMLVEQIRILYIPDGLAEHPDHVACVGAAAAARAGDLPLVVCARPERREFWTSLARQLGLTAQAHPDPDTLDATFPFGYALVLDMRGFARSAFTCDNAAIVVARDEIEERIDSEERLSELDESSLTISGEEEDVFLRLPDQYDGEYVVSGRRFRVGARCIELRFCVDHV